MRDHKPEFQTRGAGLAAIGLGDLASAKAFREARGLTFPLLVDTDRAAYRAAALRSATFRDLLRPANFVAGRRARAAGHRQGKTGANPFQLGGSFVFGPGAVDRYAHVSQTFGDNAPVSALLAVLDR